MRWSSWGGVCRLGGDRPCPHVQRSYPSWCVASGHVAARKATVVAPAPPIGAVARAQQHLREVQSRRLARRPVRRVILGHQARLIFTQPCAEQEAPALLQAAVDLATRLQCSPEQAVRRNGDPDVKVPGQRHHCRHRWRILVEGAGGGVVYLSLSTHHREGSVGLPYVWVQGTPALVWRVAGFFRA